MLKVAWSKYTHNYTRSHAGLQVAITCMYSKRLSKGRTSFGRRIWFGGVHMSLSIVQKLSRHMVNSSDVETGA
jgi:hypothetical protein